MGRAVGIKSYHREWRLVEGIMSTSDNNRNLVSLGPMTEGYSRTI